MPHSEDTRPTVVSDSSPIDIVDDGPLHVGALLGRYAVLGLLGKGGMGRVYRGYDPKLRREVAVKVLTNEGGEDAVARLIREAQAMAQLSHPNVVPVYDVEERDGRVFLAMELVEGQTLTEWLREDHTPERALELLIQAGRGLAAAHAVDLVHRDFKPGNVMVGRDGRARVMDFGIARAASEAEPDQGRPSTRSSGHIDLSSDSLSTPLTEAGVVLGTPSYMAPEQHVGMDIDHRCDQYAFCVTLYQAIAGVLPFKTRKSANLRRAKLEETPPPLEGVARHVRAAVARGLSPEPSDRFESMAALLAELERRPGAGVRRLALLGAAGLLAGGAWGWSSWSETQRESMCRDAASAIEATWNPDRRARIDGRMRATKLPYAQDSADSALSWMDAWAQDWADGKEESCRRASVTQTWSPQMLTRADWCLALQRVEFDALAERLSLPAPVDVEVAAERAAKLPSARICLDERSLIALDVPPPQKRDAAILVMTRLARASALTSSDRADEGLELAREALLEAEELEAGAAVAKAHLVIADALDARGEYGPGTEARKRGYFEAMEAEARHIATDAAVGLIFSTGVNQSHEEVALDWYRHARVAQKAAGIGEQDLAATNAEYYLATVDFHAAKVRQAIPRLREVLAVREAILGDSHPEVAAVLSLLASSIARDGRIGEARPLFERALEIQEAAYGEEHPAVATILHNVATGLHIEGKYDAAAKIYERSLAIREHSLRPDHPDIALSLNNLAGIAWELGDKRKSLEISQRALEIYESQYGLEHPRVANSLAGVAGTHVALGEAELAVPLLERAVRIYDVHPRGPKSNEPTARIELAKALAATGGNLQRAREQATKARQLYEQLGDGGTDGVADAQALLVELSGLP